MIVFKKIDGIKKYLKHQKISGLQIGFVPTMGALHQGHLSLIEMSKKSTEITVCSIFVNPTQFNDSRDFEKYPITIENDILLLEKAGCDVLFLPLAEEIYPNGTALTTAYNLGNLETILEGKFRPNHFQGVCQIVHRLLKIVQPNELFLGQKDYQQCQVIKKMMQLNGIQAELKISNTLRETSGLAMSSRNMRLSEADKQKATAIYESLKFIQKNINTNSIIELKQEATKALLKSGFKKVDYVEICDAINLQPITTNEKSSQKIALVAAFLNDVRLIDNLILQ
ncbi:MAG: pantoate--beta-alanine ligase [Pedobacter sp.]|nr:pantoate--beta-alanine ligase [Chitinophagaceae bacterium]